MRANRSNLLYHNEGGGEFTVTLGLGRGNIEEKSGERLGYRERPPINPFSSTVAPLSSTLRKTCLNLVHDIPLVDIEQRRQDPRSVALQRTEMRRVCLPNDRNDPGRRLKGQQGSGVLQRTIGGGEVEIGRKGACCHY